MRNTLGVVRTPSSCRSGGHPESTGHTCRISYRLSLSRGTTPTRHLCQTLQYLEKSVNGCRPKRMNRIHLLGKSCLKTHRNSGEAT